MKYITQEGRELLKEDEESTEPEHLASIRRANTSTAAQSGKKPKMRGKFSTTPRKGEVGVPEVGATLPRARVHPMRRLGQILGKMARISGSAPESVDPTRRR